mmetsp:Transcript_99141/g.175718  ORF Transcript_99141/g.175718 Transcript_99141/m.175718 type:complete len:819 (+) Transcript_99141:135-2591(+)
MAELSAPVIPPEAIHTLTEETTCTLSWRAAPGQQASLDLTVVLATGSGELMGEVDGRLKAHALGVERQWRECGVLHAGAAPAALEGKEVITLDLPKLADAGIIECLVLTAKARSGIRHLEDVSITDLSIFEDGRRICETNLSGDQSVAKGKCAIAGVFLRAPVGNNWSLAPVLLPASDEGVSQEAIMQLLPQVRQSIADHRAMSSESRQVRELEQRVARASGEGDYQTAILAQEELIQLLASGCRPPSSMNDAINHLEELQRLAVTATPQNTGSASNEQHLQQARIECLDELGYQEIASLNDSSAMALYIKRILEAHGGRVREDEVAKLAPLYSGEQQTQTFEDLLAELRRCSWASMPPAQSSSASSSTPARAEPAATAAKAPGGPRGGYPASEAAAAPAAPVAKEPAAAPAATAPGGSVKAVALLEPATGSVKGGTTVKWIGPGQAPAEMQIGGRPCAALEGGIFVTPNCRGSAGPQAVLVTAQDGSIQEFFGAFTYWTPGQLLAVEPARASLLGGKKVRVTTTDLGAFISDVIISGISCSLEGDARSTFADIILPKVEAEGYVNIEVHSTNGNSAKSSDAFSYYAPELFGHVGSKVEVSDSSQTAKRVSGVTSAVCIGGYPLRKHPEGQYFELRVNEVMTSTKTMAVGVATAQKEEDILRNGAIWYEDAKALDRKWLAGYDARGAQFISDKEESKIDSWRPIRDVRVGSRIGVLWATSSSEAEGADTDATAAAKDKLAATKHELVIFHDGVEKVRLQATGRLPEEGEKLFAIVDLQGTVKSVTLLEGASPPIAEQDVDDGFVLVGACSDMPPPTGA